MEHLSKLFKEELDAYSVPFKIAPSGNRVYYLIGLSKHARGYQIMKDIMASESPKIEGVPLMEFNPKFESHQLLLGKMGPLDDLARQLKKYYSGRSVSPEEMLIDHGVGKPYILSNYQKACIKLFNDEYVTPSRKPARKNTWAKDIKAEFPVCE